MEEIQFIEKGSSKNCLLLIHGFCSGPEDWEDQIKFFCADFTVLAPTLRGHDGNNFKNRPMSIEQLSNDCIKILEKKSFKKVVIAGHSMGTRLAIDIASKISTLKVESPPERQEGIKVETVDALVDKLRNEAKVI